MVMVGIGDEDEAGGGGATLGIGALHLSVTFAISAKLVGCDAVGWVAVEDVADGVAG